MQTAATAPSTADTRAVGPAPTEARVVALSQEQIFDLLHRTLPDDWRPPLTTILAAIKTRPDQEVRDIVRRVCYIQPRQGSSELRNAMLLQGIKKEHDPIPSWIGMDPRIPKDTMRELRLVGLGNGRPTLSSILEYALSLR